MKISIGVVAFFQVAVLAVTSAEVDTFKSEVRIGAETIDSLEQVNAAFAEVVETYLPTSAPGS